MSPGKHLPAIGIGLVVGLFNGLLAAGGTLLVPAMVHLLKMEQKVAHGTSLWVILPTSAVSLAVYLSNRNLRLALAWSVAAGGLVGGCIGAWLLPHIPGIWLKRAFALVMFTIGVRMVLG